MRKYYSLYGQLLNKAALYEAYRQVKRAKGAAGIDRQSLSAFAENLDEELEHLLLELKEKRYQLQPVKRVTLPKAGGGERKRGIPTVRDRVVQQALWHLLESLFDPGFSPIELRLSKRAELSPCDQQSADVYQALRSTMGGGHGPVQML